MVKKDNEGNIDQESYLQARKMAMDALDDAYANKTISDELYAQYKEELRKQLDSMFE